MRNEETRIVFRCRVLPEGGGATGGARPPPGGAFFLSQRQIALAREQIAIQQSQIRETQADLAHASFLGINAEVDQLGNDFDQLMTASGYLEKLIERFPRQGSLGGWAKALLDARRAGVDALSQSAAGAALGMVPES